MTPKQKAIELVDKYVTLTDGWVYGVQSWNYKKKCALIAVDEILKQIEKVFVGHLLQKHNKVIYWEQVKQEIEKL